MFGEPVVSYLGALCEHLLAQQKSWQGLKTAGRGFRHKALKHKTKSQRVSLAPVLLEALRLQFRRLEATAGAMLVVYK